MRVTHAQFEEYLQVHAEKVMAEAKLEKLREVILPHLQNGGVSPADLPYRIHLQIQTRTQYDWKGVLWKELKRRLRTDKAVVQELSAIQGTFETKEVPALVVKINEQYAAKQLAAS